MNLNLPQIRILQTLPEFFGRLGLNHDDMPGPELPTLKEHEVDLLLSRQGPHAKAIRVSGHHVQGAGANRPGGAQYGQIHADTHEFRHMASGKTGNKASTRSSTPP